MTVMPQPSAMPEPEAQLAPEPKPMPVPSPPLSPGHPRIYDVRFAVPGGRFFRRPYHGVALSDEAIAWIVDARTDTAPLSDIVSVHLETAGTPQFVVKQCKIVFANGVPLTVTNIDASGRPDEKMTVLYRDFVHDLHVTLAARPANAVRFTAGLAPWRYKLLLVTAIFAGLLFVVTPLVLLALWPDLNTLGLLAAGVGLCWPLAIMLRNNKPRDYTPDRLPEELLA